MRPVWKGVTAGLLAFVLLEVMFLHWGHPFVGTFSSRILSPPSSPGFPSPAGSPAPTPKSPSASGSPSPPSAPELPQPLGLPFKFPVKKEDAEICKRFTGGPEQAREWWHWACLLNKYFATKDYDCKKPANAGNWVICLDPPWTPPSPCLVYSAGIANQWSFDDYMSKKLNCTVHSFDPSMKKDHFMRTPKSLFYNIGLGGKDSGDFVPRRDGYVREDQKWTMMTLGSIMKYLGHQNLIIDVLKIDIELSEWPLLEYLLNNPGLLAQVRQLAIEWHIFRDAPKREDFETLYRNLLKLRSLGFYAFSNRPYGWRGMHDAKKFNSQSEMSYVNMQFAVKERGLNSGP